MYKNRPVDLNLLAISFPIPAIASILHRISGVFLFLYTPVVLWFLSFSLRSAQEFYRIQTMLAQPLAKLAVLFLLANLYYHLLAGFRHILMDMGYFETLRSGRMTAWIVIIAAIILFIATGMYLW